MLYTNKDLRKLIVPLVFEQLLAILVGMVDTVMIAGVGEAAVSGVSLVDTINILIINITAALATGGAVVAGHFLGQKDSVSASRSAWQLVLFSIWLSLIVTIIFMAAHKPLLGAVFGQVEAEVMESATTYLVITAISICPLAIYNSCAALFRAMNDSRTTMLIAIVMNLINLAGNAILIYGVKIGVAGAAIATTASRTAAAVIILFLMFHSDKEINFRGQASWKIDFALVKKILYIGIPNGLENSLFQLGKILLLSLISTFGTYAIAANAVCNTLACFNVLPGQAINLALLSVAAMCIGAGDYGQARYYTKKLMWIAIGFTGALSVALAALAPWILKIYQLTPQTEGLAAEILRWHALLAVLFWVPSFTLPNTLRAAGDVIWSMVIAIVSMWVFRIGFAYIFSFYFDGGLLGVWIAMTIDWAFRGICYGLRYHGHKWERLV
ncbi:MATE family efflux transporter [Parablautia intestinalis]|uniref:MATE family efflux transporter n=1 Tax=Parablautia intestinalis TaxID=2320100 RepID=UPI00256EFD57|nr:MATE family efflux transporter [Parablautia intestinalis]